MGSARLSLVFAARTNFERSIRFLNYHEFDSRLFSSIQFWLGVDDSVLVGLVNKYIFIYFFVFSDVIFLVYFELSFT